MLHSTCPLGTMRLMHLTQYLTKKNLTHAKFAEIIGVHRSSVVRFCKGSRKPDLDTIRKIDEATKGKVKAEDFYQAAVGDV